MINLTPPLLDPRNIDRNIVCIRPKRQGGARIETEQWNNKLVVHNYGHGGFGWSLLPGSVAHALSLFHEAIKQEPARAVSKKVTVIGAGCYGLLTALLLHESGWDVSIVAEQTEQLTSHKAAGSLAVIAIKASAANQALMDRMAVDSYLLYKKFPYAGVNPLSVYMIHEGTPDYRYPLIAAGVMSKPDEVVVGFGNGVTYKAKRFDTFFLDTTVIMQELANKVLAYNIPVTKKKIISFADIESPTIFNCAGLGARAWDTKEIVPVQGYLVGLKNQPAASLNYIIYAHIKIDGRLREISWTPKGGGMLGGSVVNGEDRLDANPELGDAIVRRAQIFFGGR